MLYDLGEKTVRLEGAGHFIAPTAAVIGNVLLKARSSVWFSAVIRGDAEYIEIGEEANVQDGAVLHADPGLPCIVGANVTIGHNAMVHGCRIGDGSLIGIAAVVLDGAVIGKNCLIGAGALVTGGTEIPDNSLVLGAPGKVKATLSDAQIAEMHRGAQHYVANAEAFAATLSVRHD